MTTASKIGFEQLEDRTLLAANLTVALAAPNLTATITDGSLSLTNTGGIVTLAVASNDGGAIGFQAANITPPALPALPFINAANSDLVNDGAISIEFNAGASAAITAGLAGPGTLTLNGGAGATSEAISVSGFTFGQNVTFNGGDGDDTFSVVSNQFNGGASFDSGAGDDTLNYGGNVFLGGSVSVDGGAGEDTQVLTNGVPDDQYVGTAPLLLGWENFDPNDDSPTGV